MKEEVKMMTQEEIRYAKNINLDVVKEALSQVKERLEDILESKVQIEQRSFVLFNGLVTLSIAEITAAYFVKYTVNQQSIYSMLEPVIIFSLMSLLLLVISMFGTNYGGRGSNPDNWLQKETLCAHKKHIPILLAYQVFRHDKAIKISLAGNLFKVRFIGAAIFFLIIGIGIAACKAITL